MDPSIQVGLEGTLLGLSSVTKTDRAKRRTKQHELTDFKSPSLGLHTLYEPSQPIVEYIP